MLTPAQELEIAAFAKHRLAEGALRQVLPICAAEGIQVLGAKGIVSSRILYARPEERYFSDIDLRILPDQVARLSRRLGERFEILPVRQRGAFSFVVGGMLVEFESTDGSPGLAGVGIDELLGRATCVDWFGAPLFIPDIHDHAVSLVVNAFKDKLWHCPPWSLEDLQRVVTHPSFRDSVFLARMRDAGLSSVGRVVASFLAERPTSVAVQSDAWRNILKGLCSSRPAYEWAAREAFQDPEGMLARVVMRLGNDSVRNRAYALKSVVRSLRGRFMYDRVS